MKIRPMLAAGRAKSKWPQIMTLNQEGYNRFTKDYYRMMEIAYRAFKQPNAVATITRLWAQGELRVVRKGEK